MFAQRLLLEQRTLVCAACPNRKIVFNTAVCGLCNCVIAAKARILKAKCPAGKWEDGQTIEEGKQ